MSEQLLKNRTFEIILAIGLIAFGCYLVWDCFDNQGKQMPWYTRWFSFW